MSINMLSIGGLVILLIFGIIAYFWYTSARIKEHATVICRLACEKRNIQFLDDTVSLHKMRIKRNKPHGTGLLRSYHFEYFYNGIRYTGSIDYFAGEPVDIAFGENIFTKKPQPKLWEPANDKQHKTDNVIQFPKKKD